MQVGAIYGTKSKLLQRVYIPHGDDGEIASVHIHPAETMLLVPLEVYQSGGAEALQALIGEPTTDGRCDLVHKDTGEIIDRIIWDATVHGDRHPEGHRVVPRGT